MILSPEEAEARVAALLGGGVVEQEVPAPPAYRFIRPFAEAANDYVELIINEEGRWLFGIEQLDAMVRGVGRGELCYVTGRPHSGKTQLVLQSIANNPDKHCLVFTLDEVDSLLLAKLVSMTRSIDNETLEQRIKERNKDIIDLTKHVAAHDFGNLIVIDQPLTFRQMQDALTEAQQYWQADCDSVVIDFLEQLPGSGDFEGVAAKSTQLKQWCKRNDVPLICLHQAGRSSGPRGQAAGMEAMRYGGEHDAMFVLEVFRKRDDESLDAFQRQQEENTVTVNVAKNKRPPCKVGEIDLFIHPKFGYIRPIKDGDKHVPGTKLTAAQAAALRS